MTLLRARIGTAGWSLARASFPGERPQASGLERYAEYFDTVEVNSTFYGLPRAATLQRWRQSTPPNFEFSVKMPKAITHEAGMVGVKRELRELCALLAHLGEKLGPLLVQLPPSLELDAAVARRFFGELCTLAPEAVVCEPRHPSWFAPRAEELLARLGVSRAGADPAVCPAAAAPGAASEVRYHRWHGSPRMYFSVYEEERLAGLARRAASELAAGSSVYCIFDNTALGGAAVNARSLQQLLHPRRTSVARLQASPARRAAGTRRTTG